MNHLKENYPRLSVFGLSIALLACTNPAPLRQEHTSLPHQITVNQKTAIVDFRGSHASDELKIATAGFGELSIRAEFLIGPGSNATERDAVIKQLKAAGIGERGIRQVMGGGDQLTVYLYAEQAVAKDCPAQPDWRDGRWHDTRTHSSGFGCSVNTNLAAQIVRPQDVIAPEKLGPANPVTAVSAVEAYQRGEATAVKGQNLDAGGGKNEKK